MNKDTGPQTFDQLLAIVTGSCTHGDGIADTSMTPRGIRIHPADVKTVCRVLHDHPSAYFDMLSCLAVVDNGPEAGTFEVIYNLYSIPFNHHLALKVIVPRDAATVDTVQDIWKTANWHEREAFDMFGIAFNGHPDLRRILLPADWDGHPLRRDYKQQAYYRGVKVDY